MTGYNDPEARADRGDWVYLMVLFLCCALLWTICGWITDGSALAWLLSLRLPAGW